MSDFNATIEADNNGRGNQGMTFGSDYVRITSDHQTIIRVLDNVPTKGWFHFIPAGHKNYPTANGGKGIGLACPGSQGNCPICVNNKSLKTAGRDKDVLSARPLYTFNVIDRTVVKPCPTEDCYFVSYEEKGKYASTCPSCGSDLSGVEEAPRNEVKIMQKGITIIKQLMAFEKEADLGDLKTYDVKLDVRGKGVDSVTTCIPKPTSVTVDDILGDSWDERLFTIDTVITPMSVESMQRVLDGESYFDVAKGA